MALKAALRSLVNLVYPPRCLLCRQPHSEKAYFCRPCHGSLVREDDLFCPRCAATVGPHGVVEGTCPLCRAHPMAFDAAVRLGVYDEHLKWAILRIKNASQEGLAETLGEMLSSTHQTRLISFKPDLIVPIPLHWRKRLGRGYNQSQALARGLGFLLGISPSPSCLKRLRHTPEQHLTTSTTARKKNVQGAFFASARVAGRRVLLVDDVMTTGATAHEAARALKKQGAKEVFLAIIARTRG